MPPMSGIELGRVIRLRDRECAIIFCTVTPEYALESYCVRAQNYLVKPCRREELFRSLDQALLRLEQRLSAGISIRTREGTALLPFHQIAYIELRERRMAFHLTDGTAVESTVLRGSFELALADLLADPRFLQPHKSFVVNMDQVLLGSGLRLTMRDRTPIPVSVRRRAQVLDRFFAYMSARKS